MEILRGQLKGTGEPGGSAAGERTCAETAQSCETLYLNLFSYLKD